MIARWPRARRGLRARRRAPSVRPVYYWGADPGPGFEQGQHLDGQPLHLLELIVVRAEHQVLDPGLEVGGDLLGALPGGAADRRFRRGLAPGRHVEVVADVLAGPPGRRLVGVADAQ